MSYQGQRDRINPGIPLELSLGEFGEFPVVVLRQVQLDTSELILDNMEVVDKPFRSGRDRFLVPDRSGQRAVIPEQACAVPLELGKQRPAATPIGTNFELGRKMSGIELKAFNAEQLLPDRVLR
jgi:hypothetical protein